MKSFPIRKQFSRPATVPDDARPRRDRRPTGRDRSRNRVVPLPPATQADDILPPPMPDVSCIVDEDFDEPGRQDELDRVEYARHQTLAEEDPWDEIARRRK